MFYLAVKNIFKRKVRSLLTLLGIVVALQLYLLMTSIMDSYDKDMNKQVASMAGKVIVTYKTEGGFNYPPINSVIEQKQAEDIMNFQYVDKSSSTLSVFETVVKPAAPNFPPQVMAVGIEPSKEEAFIGKVKAEGEKKLKNNDEVILGAGTAKYYKVKVGDNITIRNEEFKVIGILEESNAVIDSSVIMTLKTSQELFVKPNLVSGIVITAEKSDKAEGISKSIQDKYSNLIAATSKDVSSSMDELLKGQRTFFAMINNTTIAISVIMIMIVMIISVFERKKEIGTLKAIGTSKGKILAMVMYESLIFSILGGIISIPTAVLVQRTMLNSLALVDLSVCIKVVGITVLIGIISGIIPAWSAQRVSPIESLRYE